MRPLISVVVPVYNGERYLADTLRSIKAQSFTDYEVIVVDDGSSDGSVGIVRAELPGATIVTQPNGGVAAARNHGVALAAGHWITLLDQDDLWQQDRLEDLVSLSQRHPGSGAISTTATKFCLSQDLQALKQLGEWADLVVDPKDLYACTLYAKPDQTIAQRDTSLLTTKSLIGGNSILSVSVFIERTVLMRAGMFPIFSARADDYGCWLNISRITPFVHVQLPTYYHRVHARSASRTKDMAMPQLALLVANWYGGINQPKYEDAKAFREAGYGYANWLFQQLIAWCVVNKDYWSLRRGLAFAFLLVPDKRQLIRTVLRAVRAVLNEKLPLSTKRNAREN